MADVIIRASQSGQCGRIGKSSGGGFSEPGMTFTQRWVEPVDRWYLHADNHSRGRSLRAFDAQFRHFA